MRKIPFIVFAFLFICTSYQAKAAREKWREMFDVQSNKMLEAPLPTEIEIDTDENSYISLLTVVNDKNLVDEDTEVEFRSLKLKNNIFPSEIIINDEDGYCTDSITYTKTVNVNVAEINIEVQDSSDEDHSTVDEECFFSCLPLIPSYFWGKTSKEDRLLNNIEKAAQKLSEALIKLYTELSELTLSSYQIEKSVYIQEANHREELKRLLELDYIDLKTKYIDTYGRTEKFQKLLNKIKNKYSFY